MAAREGHGFEASYCAQYAQNRNHDARLKVGTTRQKRAVATFPASGHERASSDDGAESLRRAGVVDAVAKAMDDKRGTPNRLEFP